MRTLPKIELHLHLDCSLSYALVARLDPAVTRAEYEREFIAPPQCTSLVDLLTRAPRGFGHFDAASSLATARLVEQFRGSRVVALDLAGDEAGFAIGAHVPAFRHALDHDLYRTAQRSGAGRGVPRKWNQKFTSSPAHLRI